MNSDRREFGNDKTPQTWLGEQSKARRHFVLVSMFCSGVNSSIYHLPLGRIPWTARVTRHKTAGGAAGSRESEVHSVLPSPSSA
jgi:hypothetical protein